MKWLTRLIALIEKPLICLGWLKGDELQSAHWKQASAHYRWQQHNKTTRR
jgi:hypothetical protein